MGDGRCSRRCRSDRHGGGAHFIDERHEFASSSWTSPDGEDGPFHATSLARVECAAGIGDDGNAVDHGKPANNDGRFTHDCTTNNDGRFNDNRAGDGSLDLHLDKRNRHLGRLHRVSCEWNPDQHGRWYDVLLHQRRRDWLAIRQWGRQCPDFECASGGFGQLERPSDLRNLPSRFAFVHGHFRRDRRMSSALIRAGYLCVSRPVLISPGSPVEMPGNTERPGTATGHDPWATTTGSPSRARTAT